MFSVKGFEAVLRYANLFRDGLITTVLLSLFTVLFGFILGLLLASARLSNFCPFRFLALDKDGHLRQQGILTRLSRFNPLSFLATVYVEIFRATPMLVQILIVYNVVFGAVDLPRFKIFGFIPFNRFLPGVVALAMNSGAYLCEIIRAGIQSIDGGQTEASRSLGLTQMQTMRYVVIPQAIKNILPAIANEFVTLIKESSITFTIGVQDLMSASQAAGSATYRIGEALVVAAVLYFCLTFPTSKIIAYFERRMSRGSKR